MEKVIAIAIPGLFIVGIIWLIIASNKRINNALSTASKTLGFTYIPVSYTHLRAHETKANLVCRLLLEKKK